MRSSPNAEGGVQVTSIVVPATSSLFKKCKLIYRWMHQFVGERFDVKASAPMQLELPRTSTPGHSRPHTYRLRALPSRLGSPHAGGPWARQSVPNHRDLLGVPGQIRSMGGSMEVLALGPLLQSPSRSGPGRIGRSWEGMGGPGIALSPALRGDGLKAPTCD